MKTTTPHRLGTLQLRIMKILWSRSEATVAQVLEVLSRDSDLAYTTVATMLRKMEKRGLVEHRVYNRTFIYRAKFSEGEVTKSMATDLMDRLFEGSLADMVSHLISSHEIDDEELGKLETMIRERRQQP